MRGGWVYNLTNRKRGVLYIGVTADIAARMVQHRKGEGSEFCRDYAITRLVYVEQHDDIEDAIAREKALKKWRRAWKIVAIERQNPEWKDFCSSSTADLALFEVSGDGSPLSRG
jgi:putative endonuclease